MKLLKNKYIFLLIILLFNLFFFKDFFFQGKFPFPGDTLVGMYHPWRDYFSKDYPNGYPFKNFLITDPVRQQYPWRKLAIDSLKKGELPFWNPYSFSGTPLLANFQSAVFYPLNIIFFLLPFDLAWGFLVFLQPLLAGIFMYLYLSFLGLIPLACFLGAIGFSYSGFFISWFEWNTVLHSALWLPFLLLATEKIFFLKKEKEERRKKWKLLFWSLIFLFALICSFLAGHPQIFLYLIFFLLAYIGRKIWALRFERNKLISSISLFIILYLLFIILVLPQLLASLSFIKLSARNFDLSSWQRDDWFLPWEHLVQIFIPDFFGNPATGNYWGVWNYGEFVSYIGVLPLIFSLFAIFFLKKRKILFFLGVLVLSLIFALPTFLARIPYYLNLPLISTMQPSRIIFLIDFSLAILAAFGFDSFLKSEQKKIIFPLVFLWIVLLGMWGIIFVTSIIPVESVLVAKRNLILPTLFLAAISGLLFLKKMLVGNTKFKSIILYSLFFILCFDLWRFGTKFNSFSLPNLIFPETETTSFLKQNIGNHRFMSLDRRIFPPNTATAYHLASIEGYDPLYLLRYGEFIAAWIRGKPDISPLSFQRIITPNNYDSRMTDLLGIKYILSLSDKDSPKLRLVFREGETRIYENLKVYPRAFLVYQYKFAENKQEAIELTMDENINLLETAIIEDDLEFNLLGPGEGKVSIRSYEPQKILIEIETDKPAILVLTDIFYPGWQAMIDDSRESVKTFVVDYLFRGIAVPVGRHVVEFYPSI